MALLEVKDLDVRYGPIRAIKGVSFEVHEGEIVSLIGANGAGKTTIMHAISGLIGKHAGTVQFDGNDVTHTAAHKLIPMGMAQVPEGRRIFQELTVYENLQLGFFTVREKALFAQRLEEMYGRFPILKERAKQVAGTLSGGEQQMLAMGRALMAKPKIMLMDEPSMGLSPLLVKEIFRIIEDINQRGTTVLLVEQNAKMALAVADRAYVLETGKITLEGTGAELAASEQVRKAYLGG
jgi:branched-chain amino acid transport system ATP-binding protein